MKSRKQTKLSVWYGENGYPKAFYITGNIYFLCVENENSFYDWREVVLKIVGNNKKKQYLEG